MIHLALKSLKSQLQLSINSVSDSKSSKISIPNAICTITRPKSQISYFLLINKLIQPSVRILDIFVVFWCSPLLLKYIFTNQQKFFRLHTLNQMRLLHAYLRIKRNKSPSNLLSYDTSATFSRGTSSSMHTNILRMFKATNQP